MVTSNKKPQSLFKISILKDGPRGEPQMKNQFLKSSKTEKELLNQFGKKIGEKPGGGFYRVEEVTKNEFNKGKSLNNINRKYPDGEGRMYLSDDKKLNQKYDKDFNKWSKDYDKISKKYDGKIAAERQVKAINKITTVAKKINPVKEVNTIKSKAIKAIKTGVKVGGVVGLIGSLFAVTKMGDSTLKDTKKYGVKLKDTKKYGVKKNSD
jgi:hypothetical protein|tara:strand:+ start:337 stop:963 length:627 start_codon:yes stop_codon:yes gene_type:complete